MSRGPRGGQVAVHFSAQADPALAVVNGVSLPALVDGHFADPLDLEIAGITRVGPPAVGPGVWILSGHLAPFLSQILSQATP